MKILLITSFSIYFAFGGQLSGRIVNIEGSPVQNVAICIEGYNWIVYSDSGGYFQTFDLTNTMYNLEFHKFGWLSFSKTFIVQSGITNIGTIKMFFGDINSDGKIDLTDMDLILNIEDEKSDNTNRFLDLNNNGDIDSTEIRMVSYSLGKKSSIKFREFLVTLPDIYTFIPDSELSPLGTSQHYLMVQLKSGRWFGVWTNGWQEGATNQSVVCHWSDNEGKTWSSRRLIDGPSISSYVASWGFPIYIENLNRIYVFYQQDNGERIYHTGNLVFRFSSDEGETWSKVYTVNYPRGEYNPSDTTQLPSWWVFQAPQIIDGKYMVGVSDILMKKPEVMYSTEARFLIFENILSEKDPTNIIVSARPTYGPGLRVYWSDNDRSRSSSQEPSFVQLSNGILFCTMRTAKGYLYYAISNDKGFTWSRTRPLLYEDKDTVLNPVASCPIYPLDKGRYILIYNNNRGDANGGKYSYDLLLNRTPSFYSIGEENLSDSVQPIKFSKAKILMENFVRPYGPQKRTEVATYPSFTTHSDFHILWYPDRKHFLLGKRISKSLK